MRNWKNFLKKIAHRFPIGWQKELRKLYWKFKVINMRSSTEDIEFKKFIYQIFDIKLYSSYHRDIASLGLPLIEHWLYFGIFEGRVLPGYTVKLMNKDRKNLLINERKFLWKERYVYISQNMKPSNNIVKQILDQSINDTGILACGIFALPRLRIFIANDLSSRDGVDVEKLLESVSEFPEYLFIIPFLTLGGAEKYTADMIDAIQSFGDKRILVLVTEQTESAIQDWQELEILKPFQKVPILFWRDVISGFGSNSSAVLARFINALHPRFIVIINSNIGLESVARYGRGLKQFSQKIVCAYFSMGTNCLGAPYGAYYPRYTLSSATALTDNKPMAETLNRLYGGMPDTEVIFLSPCVKIIMEEAFSLRVQARLERIKKNEAFSRWLWISRIEPNKGTELLGALAKEFPLDEFHIFGSLDGDIQAFGLAEKNIIIHPPLADVLNADFSDYDGFIFTSLFEGMPNTVLELSQHAIPMILTDVGGLGDTFDDSSVIFIKLSDEFEVNIKNFSNAMHRVKALTEGEIINMVQLAKKRVSQRHSQSTYAAKVQEIFGLL